MVHIGSHWLTRVGSGCFILARHISPRTNSAHTGLPWLVRFSRCFTMLHNRSPCSTTDHHAPQQITMLHNRSPCSTTDHHASAQITMLHNRSPCFSTVSCWFSLWCTVVHIDAPWLTLLCTLVHPGPSCGAN